MFKGQAYGFKKFTGPDRDGPAGIVGHEKKIQGKGQEDVLSDAKKA